MVENMYSRAAWVQIPDLPLTNRMTWNKSPKLSVTLCHHMQWEYNSSPCLIRLLIILWHTKNPVWEGLHRIHLGMTTVSGAVTGKVGSTSLEDKQQKRHYQIKNFPVGNKNLLSRIRIIHIIYLSKHSSKCTKTYVKACLVQNCM